METTVTRYPTGVFGISHQGNMFYCTGFSEDQVKEKLERMGVPQDQVRWVENYYDRRFAFGNPRGYKTRKYRPKTKASK